MNGNKILIVEDEQPLRGALLDKLTQEGFAAVSAAVNGEEGLEAAEAEMPDLILLDLLMPRMDGMTMLVKLKATEWGKEMKVLVLTNAGETEKVAEALEAGAIGFLIKSDWKMEDVVAKIQEVLGK